MKQVHALLSAGDGHGACRRLGALLAQQNGSADAMADIAASILWTHYEQFYVQAVHDFYADMSMELPAVVVERIEQALGPKIERTNTWLARLRDVTQERLVRESRALIVTGDVKGAAARAHALLDRAADEAQLDDHCLYLARAMADLTRDRERCLQVIGLLMKAGGQTAAAAGILASQFTAISREQKNISFQTGEHAWLQNLNGAILSLREFTPGPNEVGEPEPAQLEAFYEVLHAILRAGMAQRNLDDLIDALWVILDYCPADPAPIRNAGGIEDHIFVGLGPRAKLTAVRALNRLGEIEPLRQTILRLAQTGQVYNQVRLLGGIVGGLRHPDFLPWLQRALGKASDTEERVIIEALGRLGQPQAAHLLVGRLEEALHDKKKRLQDERINSLLIACGRVNRLPGQDPAFRNQFTMKVMKAVGSEDRHWAFRVAEQLFSNRLEELSPGLKGWAAERTVDALWSQPRRTEGEVTPSGWREPMVTVLLRLGPPMLPIVLDAAKRYATTYSGAMSALARVLAEIGNEQAVPVLETMARTAFLYKPDEKRSRLLDEKVVNAASGETQDLDRDDVVHSILFALAKVGGDHGLEVVLNYADQVQSGRLESPGQQTINMLLDTKLKHGRLGQVAEEIRQAAQIDEKAYKTALANAKGGLLTRRETRIAGIVALGNARRLDAIKVLRDALADKDLMISSSAHTALAQYLQPLPAEKAFTEFADALLEGEASLKGRLLERLLEFIRREIPKNAPYDRLWERQVEIAVGDEMLTHQLRGAALRGDEERAAGTDSTPAAALSSSRSVNELEKRRAYLQARRDWVARGKVGDPPTLED